jgi:hypothetical protein
MPRESHAENVAAWAAVDEAPSAEGASVHQTKCFSVVGTGVDPVTSRFSGARSTN